MTKMFVYANPVQRRVKSEIVKGFTGKTMAVAGTDPYVTYWFIAALLV